MRAFNVGHVMTQAMKAQRRADLRGLAWSSGLTLDQRHRLLAYIWWGWNIDGRGGIGKPGWDV